MTIARYRTMLRLLTFTAGMTAMLHTASSLQADTGLLVIAANDLPEPGNPDDAPLPDPDDAPEPGNPDDAPPADPDDAPEPGNPDDAPPADPDDAPEPGNPDDAPPPPF